MRLAQARRVVLHWLRWGVHSWRSSLQFRVVATTMVLGIIVVMLLGGYLYQSISDGLERDRMGSAQVEAARLTSDIQGQFDRPTRLRTPRSSTSSPAR
jgi:two-component system sensor histidine kinase MtrB